MAKRDSALTGACGVYHVASVLTFRGLHAAITAGNAPYVDIIASLPEGSASVALQVKTTDNAIRTRGRGKNKVFHHYEWNLGRKFALANNPDLIMAFVDLRDMNWTPDVFVVPSTDIHYYYKQKVLPNGEPKWWRWHPLLEEANPYKNRWAILEDYLCRAKCED